MSILAALGFKPKATVNDNPAQIFSAELMRKLEQRAWDDAADILADATEEGRERILAGIGSHPQCVPLTAQWAQACPESALAHLALGAAIVLAGWEIRGTSYADQVEEAAWMPFLESMGNAEAPLLRAAALDERSADAFAWLISAALGRGEPRAVLDDLFARACEREPLHCVVHRKYFHVTLDKWGGSHEEMFAFADEVSQKAPRGSVLHVLVAASFNEYLLAMRGKPEVSTILSADNAAKVTQALLAMLDVTPDSLAGRLSRPETLSRNALNHFAVALFLTGAWREARLVTEALRGEIEMLPWVWLARDMKELKNPAYVHDRVLRAVKKFR